MSSGSPMSVARKIRIENQFSQLLSTIARLSTHGSEFVFIFPWFFLKEKAWSGILESSPFCSHMPCLFSKVNRHIKKAPCYGAFQ